MVIEITSGDILTTEQLQKHAKIYAGPGAGKTHFLVNNVKNIVTTNPLITQSNMRKVLCITYTNAAVNEINRRLGQFSDNVEVYTIHSFIIKHIIQLFQQDIRDIMKSDFDIEVSDNGKISSQVEGMGILQNDDKNEIYKFIRETNSLGFQNISYKIKDMGKVEIDNATFVNSVKTQNPRSMKLNFPEEISRQHVYPIKKYIWSIKKKLTHNEILYFGYRILESNPIALYSIRVKFPFIFVDEFQDTNPLQTLLIKLIGQKSTVIGVIGDIAQSIYGFQGAKPKDFKEFSIDGSRELAEYYIKGNRRSTVNVVNFCNFLRQSDGMDGQCSIRLYDSEEKKAFSEAKKIHFLVGNSPVVYNTINDVLNKDGVILTRSWTAAFKYIKGVCESQIKSLNTIYYSYNDSSIQIRDEIVEHNNVTWVKAFRFIFRLWESYKSGSFANVIEAVKLYSTDIDIHKIEASTIRQLNELSGTVFSEVTDQIYTCDVINRFNNLITKPEFINLREVFFNSNSDSNSNVTIPLFDDLENMKRKTAVQKLYWSTSYKLFTDVFSENSKYMTVHHAKGLEWDSVIVSIIPSKYDATNLDCVFSNPQLMQETPDNEFTRLYYVACSRAKEDLYIHVADERQVSILTTSMKKYMERTGQTISYETIRQMECSEFVL